jgi:hypothetical protein
MRRVERRRTSSEEEIRVDCHCDETFFATDFEVGFQIKRLFGDVVGFLLGEAHVADVMVDESFAYQRVEVVETTVEGDGGGADCSGGEDDFGSADVELFDGVGGFVSDLESIDCFVATPSSSGGSLSL